MKAQAKLRLSRLRDIGWKEWDPIGLLAVGDTWEGKPFADEYDNYLAYAAGQLRRGAPKEEIVSYLEDIQSNHMGLGPSRERSLCAARTVDAILADKKLWNET